jgi:dihydrofolate reductase
VGYGDKPTFVLTSRDLPRTLDTVEFYSGRSCADRARAVAAQVPEHLVRRRRLVCGECLRLGLADEVRYSILPIVIGNGIRFFERLDRDVPLHLAEVKAYKSGAVELRYEVM